MAKKKTVSRYGETYTKKPIDPGYDPYKDNPFKEPTGWPNRKETWKQFERRLRNYIRYEENRAMKQLQLPFYEEVDGKQLKLF